MVLKNTRVAVTGGAGFIGSHLVDRLLTADNEVIVIDDFSTGQRENLAHHENDKRLRVENTSILDKQALTEFLADVQYVFHLATRSVRLSLRHPTLVHDVNTTGTLNVLEAAAGAGVTRFLYCSSSEVNGTATVVPLPEDYQFKPETIYGASKLTGEYYTQVFERAGWLSTVIARPHNNYGPRSHYDGIDGELIPRAILWALAGKPPVIFGDGSQTRDFTYVDETADFLVKLMETDAAAGNIFNVCTGEETSILEIVNIICETTGFHCGPVHVDARPSDVLRLWGDPTRLFQMLKAKPSISIHEGLTRTVEWFKDHVTITPELLESLQPENWTDTDAEPWLAKIYSRARS